METIIVALIGAVSASIIAPIVTYMVNRKKTADTASQAVQRGMRALLWRELNNLHHEAVERGGMTVEQRHHLEDVYDSYHSLGANGTGTRLFDDAMRLPVLE